MIAIWQMCSDLSLIVFLICISLVTNDVEHYFNCIS